TGDLSLIAGWDGATGAGTGLTFVADATGTTGRLDNLAIDFGAVSFGNNQGDIFIGDGTQGSGGIAVGSRNGATTVLARNLSLRGSDNSGSGHVQIGFKATDNTGAFNINGGIE